MSLLLIPAPWENWRYQPHSPPASVWDQKELLLLGNPCLSLSLCQHRVQRSSFNLPTQLSVSRVSSPVLTSVGKFVYAKCGLTFYCYYCLNNTNIPCHCIKWNEESVICPLEAVSHMCKYNTIPHRERSSLHFGVLAQLSGMFPLRTEQRLGLLLGLQWTLEHRSSGKEKVAMEPVSFACAYGHSLVSKDVAI